MALFFVSRIFHLHDTKTTRVRQLENVDFTRYHNSRDEQYVWGSTWWIVRNYTRRSPTMHKSLGRNVNALVAEYGRVLPAAEHAEQG